MHSSVNIINSNIEKNQSLAQLQFNAMMQNQHQMQTAINTTMGAVTALQSLPDQISQQVAKQLQAILPGATGSETAPTRIKTVPAFKAFGALPFTIPNAPTPGGIGDTFIPARLSCAGCGSTGACKCLPPGGPNQASSSEDNQVSKHTFFDKLRERKSKNVEALAKEVVAIAATAAVTTLVPVLPPRDLSSPTHSLPIAVPQETGTIRAPASSSSSSVPAPALDLGDQSAKETPVLSGNPAFHQPPDFSAPGMNPWPPSGSEKSIDSEQGSQSERSHSKTKDSESDPELIEHRGK